jgi:Na+/proline symporter/signal transduction histidine kinase
MSNITVILWSVFYLIILFGIGYYAEFRSAANKSIINNPYIYALSLAVYCTAWTFFGSVGRVTSTGVEYLYIYLGPAIMAPLFWILLRKIIRISKTQRITSIADFISTRYGKNISLGVIVTLLSVIGIIPYIAIQLKAISSSIEIVTSTTHVLQHNFNVFSDNTFYIAIGLSAFVILFGTRSVDATEKHEGMVAAIAFESIIKILAFTIAGIFVTFFLFNGFGEVIKKSAELPSFQKLFLVQDNKMYIQMFAMMMLSMLAVLFLPRQFQISVVENMQEQHLNKAMWLFPLYLLIINLFVVPIAFGGSIIFNGQNINADTYVLALPIKAHQPWLVTMVYIGGFSAASSMIIVETIALSTMISNHIVMPLLLFLSSFSKLNFEKYFRLVVISSRRISIVVIILMAYLYDRTVAEKYSLVSIGLVSFTAVAQFAPAVILGIYWKQANKNAALVAILVGFVVWFFTLVVPYIVGAGFLNESILKEGLFNIKFLKPLELFGMSGFDTITHGFFWSMFFNTFFFVGISLFSERNKEEIYQAEMFVDIFKHSVQSAEGSIVRKGTAFIPDITSLLYNFIGKPRTDYLLAGYARRQKVNLTQSGKADPMLVSFAERVLAGAIGSASARIMVKNVVKEEELSIDEVLKILRESQMMKETNKELRRKSQELSKATEELRVANQQLKQIDEMKDEFLYTVTHELRTPLTSIRALSEIVHDNPDIPDPEKNIYLESIIKETERLSHLITQVLNLERYESGRTQLNLSGIELGALLYDIEDSARQLLKDKGLQIHFNIQTLMPLLEGDVDLLTQVFYNLTSNAIKHAKKNILVEANYQVNIYRISIKDDGTGIPIELQELVFDKFFQAKNQTLKKPEGSGLGLAICKRIVEMHEGKIWIENTENVGACFIVEIPHTVLTSKFE